MKLNSDSGLTESTSESTSPRHEDTPRIESGLIGAGFWARCGQFYAGGYRTERGAINAVKRKLNARNKLNETRVSFGLKPNQSAI